MPRALIPKQNRPKGAHECSFCQKAFKNRSELGRHENIHSDDKPFVCHVCQKKFSQNGQLTNHLNTHTGNKPSLCAYCPRGFAEGGSTGRHEREQHSNFAGFRCPVSGCEYMHKRKGDYNKHLKSKHGVSASSVDPWHHAYTTDGQKIDPTRGLRAQLEWEPSLQEGRDSAKLPNRARAKRLATSLGKEPQTLPAPRSRKRCADEFDEDEDEDEEEYKPKTRSRTTKRVRQSEPEPEAKPAIAVAGDTFNELFAMSPLSEHGSNAGLFTIAPTSEHGNNAGIPSGSSSGLTSLVAPPAPQQGGLQFVLDAYTGGSSLGAGPSFHYDSQNLLGLSLSDNSSVYLGYQPLLSGDSTLDQYGAAGDLGSFMPQQVVPHGFNQFDITGFEASLCDETFLFNPNDPVHAQPTQFHASYDSYNIAPHNASPSHHHYQYQNLAPALSPDLLSASSPLTSSSQASRSPSPLGLGQGNNGFSVPAISGLGRALANAPPMMPQQDMVALFNGSYA